MFELLLLFQWSWVQEQESIYIDLRGMSVEYLLEVYSSADAYASNKLSVRKRKRAVARKAFRKAFHKC